MNIYNKSWLSWYIGGLMEIQRLLSKTPEQLREYCESLGYEDKQNLYKQVVDEAKGKRLRELKQLSKLATAIEKTTDKKLLKPFRGDDNPLNGVVILSFFGKLSRRLLLIMHSSVYDKSLKQLDELDELLPQMYGELRPKLTSSMRNYAERELRFSNFLRDNIDTFKLLEKAEHGSIEERKKAAIALFIRQPELNFQGDVFLLGLISQHIGVFRNHVKRKVDDLIDSLEKGLEKLENVEEDTEEYGEIENELIDERSEVMNELRCLVLSYALFEETHEQRNP
nr:putative rhoptry protein [Wolbachia endosymbiont of Ceratosolen solmsi]